MEYEVDIDGRPYALEFDDVEKHSRADRAVWYIGRLMGQGHSIEEATRIANDRFFP